jgi:hypothetical protein
MFHKRAYMFQNGTRTLLQATQTKFRESIPNLGKDAKASFAPLCLVDLECRSSACHRVAIAKRRPSTEWARSESGALLTGIARDGVRRFF